MAEKSTKTSTRKKAVVIDPFESVVETAVSASTVSGTARTKASVKTSAGKAEAKVRVIKKAVKATEPIVTAFDTIADDTPKIAEPVKRRSRRSSAAVISSKTAEPPKDATSPVKKRVRKTPVKAAADAAAENVETPKKTVRRTPAKRTAKPKAVSAKVQTPEIALAADTVAVDNAVSTVISVKPEIERSPAFKALADVQLPNLARVDRARLLMQSPTRLYFYWSIKNDPWKQLHNVFGDETGSYTLVAKLTDLTRNTERFDRVEREGSWWYDVDPDGEYEAEIGFVSADRPYFRIVYSNSITTPRRSPSSRPASDAQWTVSANKFAEMLDVAGFSRDAYDVAIAGDDIAASYDAARTAFTSFIGEPAADLDGIAAEDLRYALLALASGFTLDELRSRLGSRLFAILNANTEKIDAAAAQSALREHFDIDETEFTEEEFGAAVYGASLVHFPRTLKTRKAPQIHSPRYNPVSSYSIR